MVMVDFNNLEATAILRANFRRDTVGLNKTDCFTFFCQQMIEHEQSIILNVDFAEKLLRDGRYPSFIKIMIEFELAMVADDYNVYPTERLLKCVRDYLKEKEYGNV